MITVIITAHDRKQYLMDAIKSVKSQTFQKQAFEVIIVKNFLDEAIDRYIETAGYRQILTKSKTLGQKISEGILSSHGDVITFLDDDDLFQANKLSSLADIFQQNKQLSYYHNSIITIDENGLTVDKTTGTNAASDIILNEKNFTSRSFRKARKYNGDWFMSCISVSRDIALASIDLLMTQKASFDKIMFYQALLSGKDVMISKNKLTYYRLHPSMTTVIDEKNSFISKKKDFFLKTMNSIDAIQHTAEGKMRNVIRLVYLHEAINYAVLSGENIGGRQTVEYLFLVILYGTSSDAIWLILYFISVLSSSVAQNLYFHRLNSIYT